MSSRRVQQTPRNDNYYYYDNYHVIIINHYRTAHRGNVWNYRIIFTLYSRCSRTLQTSRKCAVPRKIRTSSAVSCNKKKNYNNNGIMVMCIVRSSVFSPIIILLRSVGLSDDTQWYDCCCNTKHTTQTIEPYMLYTYEWYR